MGSYSLLLRYYLLLFKKLKIRVLQISQSTCLGLNQATTVDWKDNILTKIVNVENEQASESQNLKIIRTNYIIIVKNEGVARLLDGVNLQQHPATTLAMVVWNQG